MSRSESLDLNSNQCEPILIKLLLFLQPPSFSSPFCLITYGDPLPTQRMRLEFKAGTSLWDSTFSLLKNTNMCFFFFFFRRRQWHPTPVLLPGKSHGQRSLVGCSPWGRTESDTTERLQFHFSLSCIGEGNGNPLQCSCLENPRDGGAWWAAVYGVTQSRTQLKRLSSSNMFFRFFSETNPYSKAFRFSAPH